ncbi:MAG: hypothetical protein HYV09_02970 [Deltaproteobacteria bacterium]|nr:hypothetical protein [Deltaproteobacteria bacterium]
MLIALASAGCAGASTSRTILRESDPIVRAHEDIRWELAERDGAGGALTPKGGCPVCQW